MNTQAQAVDQDEDDEYHEPIFWTIFNPEGKVHKFEQVCSCELHQYKVDDFPKGAYMIALDVPLTVH